MKRLITVALFSGVSILATGIAQAQTKSATQASAAATRAVDASQSDVKDIVVTGSRVISNGNKSPTPLTVLPVEQFSKLAPTTITDAVNLLPGLQGSQGTTTKSGGGQRDGAAAYFNLRDMGDLRTLVLYDGQRLIPTINQNQADVNAAVVPQMLLKRVDVVTGGVSAVYGSDAVSGVVNFITDNNFNGVKVQASSGVSTYGDDSIKDIGVAAGSKFAGGRGHIEVSYQYHDDPGILHKTDRPYFAADNGAAGAGTAANPYFEIPNQRLSSSSFSGLINSGPLAGLQFAQPGILSPFNHGLVPTTAGTLVPFGTAGITAATANVESGGDGIWFPNTSIKAANEFHQAFGRLDYDVTDAVHAHVQVAASAIHTYNNYSSPNFSKLTISYANPFLAGALTPTLGTNPIAGLAANPANTFTFSKLILNEPRAEQNTNNYMVMAGLEGSIGRYKWDINFEHAQSILTATNDFNVNYGHFYAAVDAIANPSNPSQTICRASLTNANYANCVPINLFGQGSESAAALNYIYQTTTNKNITKLNDINASFKGSPFDTWAGPVNMALSGELRRTYWQTVSSFDPNGVADCSGIKYNCKTGVAGVGTSLFEFQNMGPVAPVSQSVAEGAFEVSVPLVKDVKFIKSFNVDGAVRYTYYDTSGSAVTWKVGLDWAESDDLRFRATRSRDIRAPNLFDLYAPTSVASSSFTDPLTNTTGNVTTITTTNSNLAPEVANTFTAGFVFKPHFIPGLSMSLDYFDIHVSNVIYQIQGKDSIPVCTASGGTSPVCALAVRPISYTSTVAGNYPTLLYNQYLNIAGLKTYGYDFELNYAAKLLHRPLNLRALVSYQPHLYFDRGPAGVIDLGNTYSGVNLFPAAPALKATGIVSYQLTDNFEFTVLEKWRNFLNVSAIAGVYTNPHVPSFGTTTMNLSVKVKPGFEMFFNVANVFNAYPTVYLPGALASPGLGLDIPAGDDPTGRYFTAGVRVKF